MSYVRDIRLQAWDGIRENLSWAGGCASGLNIYAYAGGDPINGTDPSGLAPGDGADHESEALGGGGCGGCEGSGGGSSGASVGGVGGGGGGGYTGGSVGWTGSGWIQRTAQDVARYPNLGPFLARGNDPDSAVAVAANLGEAMSRAGLGATHSNLTGEGAVTAYVGGFFDTWSKIVLSEYEQAVANNQNSAYFTWDQNTALANFIAANQGQVNLIGHSYGADTAASVVAAGYHVLSLTTIDPVGWFKPDFSAVATNAGSWTDLNATGGSPFGFSNFIAGIGGAYGQSPAAYATTFRNLPYTHAQIGFCAGGGC